MAHEPAGSPVPSPSATSPGSDLALHTGDLDRAEVTVRELAERLSVLADGVSSTPEHLAAAVVGHERLAAHLRAFAEAGFAHRAALVSEGHQLAISIALVSEVFASLERLIALRAASATPGQGTV